MKPQGRTGCRSLRQRKRPEKQTCARARAEVKQRIHASYHHYCDCDLIIIRSISIGVGVSTISIIVITSFIGILIFLLLANMDVSAACFRSPYKKDYSIFGSCRPLVFRNFHIKETGPHEGLLLWTKAQIYIDLHKIHILVLVPYQKYGPQFI